MKTFAILLQARTLSTFTSILVTSTILIALDLSFECLRITQQDSLDCVLTFLVVTWIISTIKTSTAFFAHYPLSKALAIEFETLGLFTRASDKEVFILNVIIGVGKSNLLLWLGHLPSQRIIQISILDFILIISIEC
jgi:hypothetical protein